MLPTTAQQKLNQLEQQAEDARVLVSAAQKAIDSAHIDLANAKNNLHSLGSDSPGHSEALARVATAEAAIEKATALRDTRNKIHRNVTQVLAQLQNFLNTNRKRNFETAPAVKAPSAPIENIRKDIIDVKAALATVKQSRLDNKTLTQQAAEQVKRLAIEGALELRGIDTVLEVVRKGASIHSEPKWNAFAFACWLDSDKVLKRIEQDIDALPGTGLPAAEKAQRVAELSDKLLTLERQEEALIVKASENGLTIQRRADADPKAILGVAFAKAQRKAA